MNKNREELKDVAVSQSKSGKFIYYYDEEGDLIYTYDTKKREEIYDPEYLNTHGYE